MARDPGKYTAATAAIVKAIQDGNYAANGVTFRPFRLWVAPASDFTPIWWTEGFRLPPNSFPFGSPITFFQYRGNNGPFCALGDVVTTEDIEHWLTHLDKPALLAGGGSLLFAPDDEHADALAHPTGFEFVANDSGSRNTHNISYWRMTAPTGYRAVGICFGEDDKPPDPSHYWCVKQRYLDDGERITTAGIWDDKGARWKSYNGSLDRPAFKGERDPADGTIIILPPTCLSVQDHVKEAPCALIAEQAMLPVTQFAPPDPSKDQNSGATTTNGLGPVAIVPYTAVPADLRRPDYAINSPFYYIASEPYWYCDKSLPTSNGGDLSVTITVGTSETESQQFQETTSINVSAKAGVKFSGFSFGVSASYTKTFVVTTAESATNSTQVQETVVIHFPKQPTTWVWSRHTDIAVFRNDQTMLPDPISYANNDQTIVPNPAAQAVQAAE